MPPRAYNFRLPSHPLLQVLYVLLGGIVLIGALFMGAVLLVVALGLGLVVGVVALLRAWWLGRGLTGSARGAQGRPTRSQSASGDLLEGEYRVVSERDESDERHQRHETNGRDGRNGRDP